MWIVCKKRGGLCRFTESVCVVASNKRGWKAYTTFTSYGMERHHLTDNINMCGLFVRRGEDFVGLLRVCASLLAIKGGGRPTRLLRHAKMLLIPIKFFFSAG